MDDKLKVMVHGTVCKAYTDTETKKEVICVEVDPDLADTVEDMLVEKGMVWSGDSMPIKTVEDADGNEMLCIKTSSKYNVPVKGEDGVTVGDIGIGTDATLYIVIKQGRYGRKKYVSAYLTGVDIHDFVEREEYNPFRDSEFTDIRVGKDDNQDTVGTDGDIGNGGDGE